MKQAARLAGEHLTLTRRHFLKLAASGVASLGAAPLFGAEAARHPELERLIAELEYLTLSEKFRNVERHRPLPYKLPPEKRLALGLERESWQLEVIADPASNSQLKNPLSKERGTAFSFPALMKLAEQRAVRYLKVMTCNNIADPLGMGLWEGVPLRDVIWLAQPEQNVRRVFYHGYHNDDPKQIFQSSLPIGRVLEDPPGEQPVLLCYRLNGQWLTGERGGPVRMIVPEAYGFKSVKWLQRVLLTNNHQANDTYAEANNDVDSPMKSYARFLHWPKSAKLGQPIPLTGVAQAGMSGLRKVQYWLRAERDPLPAGDRYFTTAAWKDAEILPPPEHWGSMLPDGKLPSIPGQFDDQGRPREWPLRHAIAHWAALLTDVPPGKYELRCRAVDANGVAQPMPRPFQKSGGNAIQSVSMTVHG